MTNHETIMNLMRAIRKSEGDSLDELVLGDIVYFTDTGMLTEVRECESCQDGCVFMTRTFQQWPCSAVGNLNRTQQCGFISLGRVGNDTQR